MFVLVVIQIFVLVAVAQRNESSLCDHVFHRLPPCSCIRGFVFSLSHLPLSRRDGGKDAGTKTQHLPAGGRWKTP